MSYIVSVDSNKAKANPAYRLKPVASADDVRYGCFRGAEVAVHLMDNAQISGEVVSWSNESHGFELSNETGASARIDFENVRIVAFKTSIPREHSLAQLGKQWADIVLPGPPKPFSIEFSDTRSMAGVMSGAMEDEAGLHIFRVQDGENLRRLFVPRDTVASYDIGPKVGQALVDEKVISRETLKAGLKQQADLRKKKVGDYLAEMAAVTPEQVVRTLHKQRDVPNMRLGDLLVHDGAISQDQLDRALEMQNKDRVKRLGCILRDMGMITEEDLHLTLARRLGIPFVRLNQFEVQLEALSLIPEEMARKYPCIPLFINQGHLIMAVTDPLDRDAVNLLRFTAKRRVELALATEVDIKQAVDRYYGPQSASDSLQNIELEALEEFDTTDDLEAGEIERMGRERPIVRFVQTMIDDAITQRASDIHIRAEEEHAAMLFRVDGSLIPIRTFSKRLLAAVVSRIKILGRMDVAEHRMPQDGQARIKHGDAIIDLRISVLPSVQGEGVVFRILDARQGVRSIAELDFGERDRDAVTDIITRSQGLFLVTGPTGSGKSTTLYAALNEIRRRNLNIITTEDPVEYHVEGVQQVQVNHETGYTFARALRHILRHDPDVVMIGEIRDQETADIAMKSAMTGHLVLSTLHTNGAVATIMRLIDMGIDSYLLGPTLAGVLAQRLVRRNCPACLAQEEVPDYIRREMQVADHEVFARGAGCDECNHTGYRGRVAAYELMVVDSKLRELIAAGASQEELLRQAVKNGMTPLTDHGIALARERTTSLAEAYRVRIH